MSLTVEPRFVEHFRNLQQVFLYITDECNLSCVQCIYKPSITYQIERSIKPATARELLSAFRNLGAYKLTLLGGEPTLYGLREGSEPLFDIVAFAKDIGYEYVRIDTNGQFRPTLLDDDRFHRLDEIAFSVDGLSSEMNDPIRGPNTFHNSVARIKDAIAKGYKTTITCCVHNQFVNRDVTNELLIHRMILFAQELGIQTINFHDLFKVGVPMDTWTGDLDPEIEAWVLAFEEIRAKVRAGEYDIHVRLPQCFITRAEFDRNPRYYGYCPVKMGERVMVHPHGVIRICSNLICTAYGVARYTEDAIDWDHGFSNEMREHDLSRHTPCTNRSRHRKYGKYVPLCFSFKPDQDDIVWQRLGWDERRKTSTDDTPENDRRDG
jgi:MoaA/NifB/PqqE/SkfB family radical SAM enzyme